MSRTLPMGAALSIDESGSETEVESLGSENGFRDEVDRMQLRIDTLEEERAYMEAELADLRYQVSDLEMVQDYLNYRLGDLEDMSADTVMRDGTRYYGHMKLRTLPQRS